MKRTIASAALIATALMPTAAMAADGGESHGSWLTFALFVINFSLFVVVVYYYGAPMVRSFFLDRSRAIQAELQRAKGALAEAEELASRAAERIGALEREAAELAGNMERETRYHLDRLTEAARSTVERIRRDAEMSVNGLKDAAQRRVRGRMAGAAADFARAMITSEFRPDDQSRLVGGFTERLGQEARQ
jgi:F0F1-type ATP synthase membrane subunit b/b'